MYWLVLLVWCYQCGIVLKIAQKRGLGVLTLHVSALLLAAAYSSGCTGKSKLCQLGYPNTTLLLPCLFRNKNQKYHQQIALDVDPCTKFIIFENQGYHVVITTSARGPLCQRKCRNYSRSFCAQVKYAWKVFVFQIICILLRSILDCHTKCNTIRSSLSFLVMPCCHIWNGCHF